MSTHVRRCSAMAAAACLVFLMGGCSGKGSGDGAIPTNEHSRKTSPTEPIPRVVTGIIEASDQSGNGAQLTVRSAEIAGAPGFLIVHREDKGGPGDVVGHVAVPEGRSTDVVVTLDEKVTAGPYWVMLHRDAGKVGLYEWPGPDGPVRAPAGLAYVQRRVELSVR